MSHLTTLLFHIRPSVRLGFIRLRLLIYGPVMRKLLIGENTA